MTKLFLIGNGFDVSHGSITITMNVLNKNWPV